MKKFFCTVLILCILISMSSCFVFKLNNENDAEGKDWHTWGIYDFTEIDGIQIAIDQINNDENRHIGFDIYMDGEELGSLLCKIRCSDGGYKPDEMEKSSSSLKFEDYNKDGLSDIGAVIKNGDIMWYIQNSEKEFTYFETQQY